MKARRLILAVPVSCTSFATSSRKWASKCRNVILPNESSPLGHPELVEGPSQSQYCDARVMGLICSTVVIDSYRMLSRAATA